MFSTVFNVLIILKKCMQEASVSNEDTKKLGLGHCFGTVIILDGVVYKFYISFESNDETLHKK